MIDEGQSAGSAAVRALTNLAIKDVTIRERELENAIAALKQADEGWALYEAQPKTAEEVALWNELKPAFTAWKTVGGKALLSIA